MFLLLGSCIISPVKANTDNNFRDVDSFYGNFTVIGFLKIVHQSNDEITWVCTLFALVFGKDTNNNFVLFSVNRNQNLVTKDFADGIITIIVFGHCSYFSIE